MLHFEFTAPNFAAALVIGHLFNTVAAWAIHYLQHQSILGLDFWRIHHAAHHEGLKHTEDGRLLQFQAIGHAVWALMFGFLFLLYHLLLTPWLAC